MSEHDDVTPAGDAHPELDNPFEGLIGILAGPGPTYDEMKAEEREVEREREIRKYGHLMPDEP